MVDILVTGSDSLEHRSDIGTDDTARVQYWLMQEAIAEKETQRWVRRAKKIVDRYRDVRNNDMGAEVHRFNILWSNVQTLMPALYSRTPKADVQRRFKDQDDVGRLASLLLERSIDYSLEQSCDFDGVMQAVVEDRLLPGRGAGRVLYVPHFGDPIEDTEAEEANDDDEAESGQAGTVAGDGDEGMPEDKAERRLVYEEAKFVYEYWEDYLEGPAREWKDVPWVRYKAYMTRDELVQRFGASIGNRINLDWTPSGIDRFDSKNDAPLDAMKKAVVHETWDKQRKEVIWWGPGTPDLVFDKRPDPLQLPNFFPGPDPAFATMTNDRRIPVPDYIEYQDQARELDLLTARIDRLTRALKVSGVYAGEEKQAIQQLISEGTENKLIPVEGWAAFATDKGGLNGLILWLPIQQIAEVLIQLYDARDRVKQILYEVTGMSDIIRGATSPNETYGAQRIKAQFVTMRLSESQRDIARFARDAMRLVGYLIAKHFDAETISRITGYPQLLPVPPEPPQLQVVGQPGAQDPRYMQWLQQAQPILAENQKRQQQFEAAVALLREDAPHDFRIDIESDTVVAADEDAEKQSRTELLQQLIPLLQNASQSVAGNPGLASLYKEMVLFALRAYKGGRELEEVVEQAFDMMGKMQPPQQEGTGSDNPQVEGMKQQGETQRAQGDANTKLQIAQMQTQQKAQQAQQQFGLEVFKTGQQLQLDRQKLAIAQQKQQDQQRFRNVEMLGMREKAAEGLT